MNRRSLLALPLGAALPGLAAPPATPPMIEKITVFSLEWDVIRASDWKVEGEGAGQVLNLLTARPQEANPRRPIQFALARTEPLGRYTLEVEVRRDKPKGSLIVVHAWRDEGHFNYVHLSDDSPAKVDVHSGIFHCYGGDRVRISAPEGPGTLPREDWHKVRVSYDASKGLVEAWVDGQTTPALKGIDLSIGAGRIGLGSFFNTAAFRNFRLTRG
jgi:hypothetical protein